MFANLGVSSRTDNLTSRTLLMYILFVEYTSNISLGDINMDSKSVGRKYTTRLLIIVACIIIINIILAVVLKAIGIINLSFHEYFNWLVDLITFHRH
jgi:hypothetical protein